MVTTDYLFEDDLAESQRPLLRALKSLPSRPRDMMNPQRVREGLSDVLALLNYERADAPVGIELGDEVDGRVVATRNGFDIIHLHLPRLRASVERPAVERVVRQHPHCMVVATSGDAADEGTWHFIYVKDAGQGRKVLRRAVVEPAFIGRTVLDTLSQCRVAEREASLDIQIAHEAAFDVEAVSKRFYRQYAEEFERLRNEIADIHSVPKERADVVVQELLNRLIFLMFIQRKGWLPTPENPDRNFLWTEFSANHRNEPDADSYHRAFLQPLFIALSSRRTSRRGLPADIRQVPFLNGGLFDLDEEEELLTLPNSAFERLFRQLLHRYNFTVREDTPLEVEVAIDPEMLGRVFENLILQLEKTGELDPRKATGSYYTPRPIVHFMCQQALKEWIVGQDVVSQEAIDTLFDLLRSERTGPDERARLEGAMNAAEAERLRDRLTDIAVVDPAVGSGAFLVGMLHELLGLLRLMDLLLSGADEIDRRNYDYGIKQGIIQRCLYGVDIQPRAVRICQLRLWLSYAVDYELASGEEPPTLPNLDYRVIAGDSLIEHLLGHDVRWAGEPQNDRERQLVDTIQEEKSAHFLTDDPQPKHALELSILRHTAELAKEILSHREREVQVELGAETQDSKEADPLIEEIEAFLSEAASLARRQRLRAEDIASLRSQMGSTFVWRLAFAEVFRRKDGFDIAIANPPYGLKSKQASERWGLGSPDSYGAFLALATQLVRVRGISCYITSNTWLTLRTHRPLRQIILSRTRVAFVLQMPPWVFDQTVSTCVVLTQRIPGNGQTSQLRVADLSRISPCANNWAATCEDEGELSRQLAEVLESPVTKTPVIARYDYPQTLPARAQRSPLFVADPRLFEFVSADRLDGNGNQLTPLGVIADVKQGLYTANNSFFLRKVEGSASNRPFETVSPDAVLSPHELKNLSRDDRLYGLSGRRECFVPYDFLAPASTDENWLPAYHCPTEFAIDWSRDAVTRLRTERHPSTGRPKARFQNSEYYFRPGITFARSGAYSPTFRESSSSVFDGEASCIFPRDNDLRTLLGILSSKVVKYFAKALLGSEKHAQVDEIKEIPIPTLSQVQANRTRMLVEQIIQRQESNPRYDYSSEQAELDSTIYEAFGLTSDEVDEVELWYARRYPRLVRERDA